MRQQHPDGVAVGEHRHGAALILRRDGADSPQHPVQHLLGRLGALDVPFGELAAEIGHLLRVLTVDVAPGALFPAAHVDLPQRWHPVEGQALGLIDGAGGGAGTVQVAGIHRVNMDILEPLFQSPDLPPAPVREVTVLLALGNAVQVALRLRVANQINGRHTASKKFLFGNSIDLYGRFGKRSGGFFVSFGSY